MTFTMGIYHMNLPLYLKKQQDHSSSGERSPSILLIRAHILIPPHPPKPKLLARGQAHTFAAGSVL